MTGDGYKKLAIKTEDANVLILAVSFFHELKVDVDKLWVYFGAGKNRYFFRVHEIYNQVGKRELQPCNSFMQ